MKMEIEWKSMESVRKNGDAVLLYVPGYPEPVVGARWDERRAAWCVLGVSSLTYNFDDDVDPALPALWADIPVPDAY